MSPQQILAELKQTRPFSTLEEAAGVGLARTAAILEHAFSEALRPHGITPTQYNVLRILRGAGPAGLCRNEVRDRLVARVPDTTRLLDRMEDLGVVSRDRDNPDRRYVTARITPAGAKLLAELDGPVLAFNRRWFGHLGEAGLAKLMELLDEVRRAREG